MRDLDDFPNTILTSVFSVVKPVCFAYSIQFINTIIQMFFNSLICIYSIYFEFRFKPSSCQIKINENAIYMYFN